MLKSSTTASSRSAHFGLVARGQVMRDRRSPAKAPTRDKGSSSGRGGVPGGVNKVLPAGGDRLLRLASWTSSPVTVSPAGVTSAVRSCRHLLRAKWVRRPLASLNTRLQPEQKLRSQYSNSTIGRSASVSTARRPAHKRRLRASPKIIRVVRLGPASSKKAGPVLPESHAPAPPSGPPTDKAGPVLPESHVLTPHSGRLTKQWKVLIELSSLSLSLHGLDKALNAREIFLHKIKFLAF